MRDEPLMTLEDLAAKVDWEGGVVPALEYGIKPEDIEDKDMALKWRNLQAAYADLQPIADSIRQVLDEYL